MGIKRLVSGEFPVLRQELDLGEFHPDLAGNTVEVWLNPSAEYRQRWVDFHALLGRLSPGSELTEELVALRASLWADLWGIPEDEVAALFAQATAGSVVTWLCARTWDVIGHYAEERAKNARS